MRSRHFVLTALAIIFGFGTFASAQTTFVYTANTLAGGGISIYKLNPTTGALVSTGPQLQNDSPAYLAVGAGGKFLIVSGGSCPGCGLETFAIDPATGALTIKQAYEQIGTVVFLVGQVANDVTGTTIYTQGMIEVAGTAAPGVLDALHVNADGTLTQIGNPFSLGPNVGNGEGPIAVDPKGRWVFTIAPNDNTQHQLLFAAVRNADGSLGAQAATPLDLTQQQCNTNIVASQIAIDPQGKNLFISCNATATATFNGIQVYGINQTTGALSRIDSFTTQHSFEALSSDRQGWRVFADTEESNLVEPFDFNRNVSQISLLNGGILYHTGSQPNGVAVDPSNSFVYVTNGSFCFPKQLANGNCTNTSSSNISGYSFNYTQGTLTALPGSPFASGPGTRSMVFVQFP
jgi:6-phosphogluconolactonase (cycloisomerase 2 family)